MAEPQQDAVVDEPEELSSVARQDWSLSTLLKQHQRVEIEVSDQIRTVTDELRGTLSELEVRVQDVERENEVLLKLVEQGRYKMSGFHANLMIENIHLNHQFTKTKAQLDELEAKEQRLINRVQYLFDDCRRLSEDNLQIVKQAGERDRQLRQLESQLKLQESRHKGLSRVVNTASEELVQSKRQHFRQDTQLHAMKQKMVRQHQSLWEWEDKIELLQEELAYLKSLHQFQSKTKGVPYVTKVLAEIQLPRRPPTMEDIDCKRDTSNHCQRKDCEELKRRLSTAQAELKLVSSLVRRPSQKLVDPLGGVDHDLPGEPY